VKLVEHSRRRDEDDALGGEASLVSESANEEGFAGAGITDEDGIDALVDEGEIEQAEVSKP
jgi:hypothetical protein